MLKAKKISFYRTSHDYIGKEILLKERPEAGNGASLETRIYGQTQYAARDQRNKRRGS